MVGFPDHGHKLYSNPESKQEPGLDLHVPIVHLEFGQEGEPEGESGPLPETQRLAIGPCALTLQMGIPGFKSFFFF